MGIRITDAANTYNIALHILILNDYKLKIDDNEELNFIAEKNQNIFFSNDPLSLLALTIISDIEIEQYRRTNYIDDKILIATNYILSKQFSITLSNKYSDEWFDWIVKKDDNEFIGSTPLKIVALILIIEKYNTNWNSQNIPNYYKNLLKNN